MFVKIIIDEKLNELYVARLNGVQNFIEYLTWSAHFGRINQIYFSIKLLDLNFIENNISVKEDAVYQRLLSLIDKIDGGVYQDLRGLILNREVEGSNVILIFNKYFHDFSNKEASHEELFVLSFLVNILIKNINIDSKLSIKLIEYFWEVKNCNDYRKSYCIFMVIDHCLDNHVDEVFRLRKRWYNHIQKIYAKIHSTSILSKLEKKNYFNNISDRIRSVNSLNSISTPKIAVCISGLYRNHYAALESIKQNVVDPLQADVFIHTWDEAAVWSGIGGAPSAVRVFGQKVGDLLPTNVLQNFHAIVNYLPHSYEILKSTIFEETDPSVFDVLEPVEVLIDCQEEFESRLGEDLSGYTANRGTLNQIKMFGGIKKSIDLALNHGRYDFIIRLRPDLLIKNKLNINDLIRIESNSLHVGVGDYGVTDTDFIFSSPLALSLSNLIHRMFEENKVSPYPDFPLYDAHNIFFAWVVENNINLEGSLIHKILLNMSDNDIKLPGLRESLDLDFKKLNDSDQKVFSKFIDFLKENYC